LMRTPYWVILYGIEVWGELATGKHKALRSEKRLVSLTRFTLYATSRGILSISSVPHPSPTLPKEQPPAPGGCHRCRRWSMADRSYR
jgi:hypothetical protein